MNRPVMHRFSSHMRTLAIAAGVAVLALSGAVAADPPSRVARLGYMTGAVSFSPAGESDWVEASMNRPLTTGDRVWADTGARAEMQVGGALVRLDAGTGLSVLNLDDRIVQLQLTQGAMNVRVLALDADQSVEVDTPNLAFTLRKPGAFRIEVDGDGNATTIIVRSGQGEVVGEGAWYVVDSRQPYRFTGTGLREYERVAAPRLDEFDRWSSERDRLYDRSPSARYVSRDVVGYQDLDANGSWRVDPSLGNVWFPNRVEAGWAPYRDGHWVWVDPWGWTWVDDAPWGFAVSHYGRWANLGGTWGWVPGPVQTRAYYAPALVVFVGGDNFGLSVSGGIPGGIGWFALGPREVYRPWYQVSRGYFDTINRSNTVINTTVINNYYDNTNVTNVTYANRQVPGAVIAVPTTTFVQSQPVSRAAIPVTREMVAAAPVVVVAPVAPSEQSVRGSGAARGKPPVRAFDRPVVARTAPPAAPPGFAAQREQLNASRGKPLDDAARKQVKPIATAQAPVVNVVAPSRPAPATIVPPASQARAQDSRANRDDARAAPAVRPAPATAAATQNVPAQAASKPSPAPARTSQRVEDKRPSPAAAPRTAVAPQDVPAAAAPPAPSPGTAKPSASPRQEPAPAAARDMPSPQAAHQPSTSATSERAAKPAPSQANARKPGRDDKDDEDAKPKR
jgi:hypothetical protein